MSKPRRAGSSEAPVADSNAAVLAELRLMNRLLATLLTRTMDKPEGIKFLAAVGYGASEIALALNMNPATVRSTLFRARKVTSAGQAEEAPTRVDGAEDKTESETDAGDDGVTA